MCHATGKYTVRKHVRSFFSLEILQAGVVMGLISQKFGEKGELKELESGSLHQLSRLPPSLPNPAPC